MNQTCVRRMSLVNTAVKVSKGWALGGSCKSKTKSRRGRGQDQESAAQPLQTLCGYWRSCSLWLEAGAAPHNDRQGVGGDVDMKRGKQQRQRRFRSVHLLRVMSAILSSRPANQRRLCSLTRSH